MSLFYYNYILESLYCTLYKLAILNLTMYYLSVLSQERSVTNVFHPHPPAPLLRKPRSHTVAEVSTSSSLENSLQDSLKSSQGSFSFSSSIDEEISPLSRSVETGRQPSVTSPPPVLGAKPLSKGKAPPPKPKPISDAG